MNRPHRILVFGEGFSLAHVTRALIAARALQDRGHEVHFATGPRYTAWVESQGWHGHTVSTTDGDQVYDRLRRLQPMFTAHEIADATRDDLRLMDGLTPDAVLVDCRSSTRLACKIADVPFASMFNANCCRYYAGVQNTPLAFPPNRLLGKGNVDRFINPWLGRLVRPAICRKLAKPYDEAAAMLGHASANTDFRDIFTSDELNLLTDLPELAPLHGAPDSYRYVGPMYWDEAAKAEDPTHRLVANLPTNRPIIYVTLGSSGNAGMLPAIASALADYDAKFVVSGADAINLPSNFIAAKFINAGILLPRCAAMICHGGNGSLYQALAYDLPTISVPSHVDQETHADQSVGAGYGLRVDMASIAKRMRGSLDTVLHEKAYKRNAAQLGLKVRQADAPTAIADAMDTWLAKLPARAMVS